MAKLSRQSGKRVLRKLYKYLASQDGRKTSGGRHSCLAPEKVGGDYVTQAGDKAEILAQHFAAKPTVEGQPIQQKNNPIICKVHSMLPRKHIELHHPVAEEAV